MKIGLAGQVNGWCANPPGNTRHIRLARCRNRVRDRCEEDRVCIVSSVRRAWIQRRFVGVDRYPLILLPIGAFVAVMLVAMIVSVMVVVRMTEPLEVDMRCRIMFSSPFRRRLSVRMRHHRHLAGEKSGNHENRDGASKHQLQAFPFSLRLPPAWGNGLIDMESPARIEAVRQTTHAHLNAQSGCVN